MALCATSRGTNRRHRLLGKFSPPARLQLQTAKQSMNWVWLHVDGCFESTSSWCVLTLNECGGPGEAISSWRQCWHIYPLHKAWFTRWVFNLHIRNCVVPSDSQHLCSIAIQVGSEICTRIWICVIPLLGSLQSSWNRQCFKASQHIWNKAKISDIIRHGIPSIVIIDLKQLKKHEHESLGIAE